MRIWILNHYASPRRGSGITTHAVLAHYLQQAGHEVTIFPAAVSREYGCVVEVPRWRCFVDQFHDGVRFRYVRARPFQSQPGRFLNMLSYGRNVGRCSDGLKRPDCIIGTCVHPNAAEAASRLARRYRVPFVYEIRDIWPESLVDLKALSWRHPLYWYFRRLEVRAFRHAAGVISVLPGIEKYAAAHGVPADRTCWIPNGIDPGLYQEVGNPPDSPPFVLSYFGKHSRSNGLKTVVDAAARLQSHAKGKGILIRLVGDGSQKPQLQDRAAALGLRNLEFLDSVPKPDLEPLARQTHAFLYSLSRLSVIEKYGLSANKLFDYLMAARPIIFSCASLNNPVAEAKAGITVPCEDPLAMADAILRLRDMPPEQRQRMGRAGRDYVRQHYNLSKIAQRLESFLVTIVRGVHESRGLDEAA